jgi:hypothetical protein
MTQRTADVVEVIKESFWGEVYVAAIQGAAVDLGPGVETTCRKALAIADRALLDYAERWLGEKAPRAKPARVEGKHGRAEVVMKT